MEEEARLRPPARRTAGAQRVVRTAEARRCSLRGRERHDTSVFATYTSGSRACVLSFKDRTLCHSKVVVNLECICRSQCSKLWFVDCCVLSEKNLRWGGGGEGGVAGTECGGRRAWPAPRRPPGPTPRGPAPSGAPFAVVRASAVRGAGAGGRVTGPALGWLCTASCVPQTDILSRQRRAHFTGRNEWEAATSENHHPARALSV